MTINQLKALLENALTLNGVTEDTPIMVTTDCDGTFEISGLEHEFDTVDNYPRDWNMPKSFINIHT